MKLVTIDDLITQIRSYNAEEEEIVTKAYNYACNLHSGQKRASGEDYISHPLNVAYILAQMHADRDTLCAALLHDVLEDTLVSKEDIAREFNPTIADLVDGVTKTYKVSFFSKNSQNIANQKKLIAGIIADVRIIIIKLADRLHNMRTLEFKNEAKQKEKAVETLEIFVPLANNLGTYGIKTELEDLALKYLKPNAYQKIAEQVAEIKNESQECLFEMLETIKYILTSEAIPVTIKLRTKHIYEIYKKLNQNHQLTDIHDLLGLKVLVDSIRECYWSLGLIHHEYNPLNDRFKDYIANPKTNMYQSLHTTVFGPKNHLVQVQIKTTDMDNIATYGLTAYWDINKGEARNVMQEDLGRKFQFYKSLNEMKLLGLDDKAFVDEAKKELFSKNIYVYTSKGDVIELPVGSNVIDFAFRIHTEVGNKMIGALVNGLEVPLTYVLKNNDRVFILTAEVTNTEVNHWLDQAHTSHAKRKIKEGINKTT